MLCVDGSPEVEVPVAFWDADGEMRFPEILIDKGGNLRAVLQNRWEDGNGNGDYYSMLPHARRLEIVDNLQAVSDLVDYVKGNYPLGEHWKLQELDKNMRIVVE